jgi:hypothetical protein
VEFENIPAQLIITAAVIIAGDVDNIFDVFSAFACPVEA